MVDGTDVSPAAGQVTPIARSSPGMIHAGDVVVRAFASSGGSGWLLERGKDYHISVQREIGSWAIVPECPPRGHGKRTEQKGLERQAFLLSPGGRSQSM